MKKRNLLIATLIMFALVVTGFTFAYWAGSLTGDVKTDNVTIEVGEGKDVTTLVDLGTLPSAANKVLVPEDRIANSVAPEAGKTLVEEIVLTYTVLWKEANPTQDDITRELEVSVEDVKIDGSTTNAGLVNIIIEIDEVETETADIKLNGDSLTVKVTITLTEPSTEEIYDLVAGKNITFTLVFGVLPETVTP